MNILWFSNTPCLAVEKLSPDQVFGGWLYSLNEELVKQDGINLSICFYTNLDIAPFVYRNTNFFPVYRGRDSTLLQKILSRLFIKPNDTKEITQLLEVVESVKPDIIHIHGVEENFGLIQQHTTIPIVISLQGILSPYYEKYFSGIPKDIVRRYESIKNKLFLRSINRESLIFKYKAQRERQILSYAKYIIGRTDWDRRVSQALAPDRKYYVVDEILRSIFYNSKWNKPLLSNHIQIVSTSSDKLYKGFETIVKTAIVLATNKKIKFTWNIIGLSENSNTVKLVQYWLNVNFKELHIVFLGVKNSEEIVDILLGSDVYCQVSRIENSPNSLAEAMLLGMPIIATNVGGTSTLLENKKEGILVQEGEPYEFAGAIQELLHDKESTLKFAKNARQKAKTTHDKKNIVNDLLQVYSSLK